MKTELTLKDLEEAIKTLKLERNLMVCSCPHCLVFGGICQKCQIFYFEPEEVKKIKDFVQGSKNDILPYPKG